MEANNQQEPHLIEHQNDLDHIFEKLYIGGKKAATNKERLKDLGIRYILNVTCQLENQFPEDFEYKQISIQDT